MKKRLVLPICALLSATCALTVHADEVKVGGGGASMADVFKPVKSGFEKATGTTLINLPSTPKDGLMDLIQGKTDVAVGAVPLNSMIDGAVKAGAKVDKASLHVQVVGKNRTVLLVHKSNHLPALSKEQVKKIFTGAISNWKEVGGEDKEIIVVWGKDTPGQNAQFIKEVLDGEPVAKDVLESSNYAKIKETVAATPEAIGIDPHGLADSEVNVVKTDFATTSDILAITIGEPSAKVRKLYDYIAGEGKRFIQ